MPIEFNTYDIIAEIHAQVDLDPVLSDNATTLLTKRYLRKDSAGNCIESPRDMFARVAAAIAMADKQYGSSMEDVISQAIDFYTLMSNMHFLPNTPTLINAGRDNGQLAACFTLSLPDSMEGIFDTIKQFALIHKSGGGVGANFGHIRPKGALVSSTNGKAGGPISFIEAINACTDAVQQGSARMGANMALMPIGHPDIFEFIKCKSNLSKLKNFNISVLVDDAFMDAVNTNSKYDLVCPTTGNRTTISAVQLFDALVNNAHATGEPGILFRGNINRYNPTPHLGEIEGCNPCAEVPQLTNESCNLGSINLSLMVTNDDMPKIDMDILESTVRTAVRFLDNVIDVNCYPLPEIKDATLLTRKIGLGVMGWAEMLLKLGLRYDSEEARDTGKMVMQAISNIATEESIYMANERGAFPAWSGSIYDGKYAIRNATRTCVAPTGSLSIIAGVTGGIEPMYSVAYTRTVLDGTEMSEVHPMFVDESKRAGIWSNDLISEIAKKHDGSIQNITGLPSSLKRLFVCAHDIHWSDHIKMQAAFQEHIDLSISKTINMNNNSTVEDVAGAIKLAYETGCKGMTVYRNNCRENQPMSAGGKTHTPEDIRSTTRPQLLSGSTSVFKVGNCGSIYITVNKDTDGRVLEVMCNTGRASGCHSLAESLSRVISNALRAGLSVDTVLEQLLGIRCLGCVADENTHVLSCADAIGKAIQRATDQNVRHTLDLFGGPKVELCADCGSMIKYSEGCYKCSNPACSWSRCG